MKNFNAEMIEKAKAAKSVEELLEIAKANNIEMTADEAKTYFAQLNPKSGELSDDDLDAVAGGVCSSSEEYYNSTHGKIVRVNNGATCKCGGNIGKVESSMDGLLIARCETCKVIISPIAPDVSYEIIG